MTFRCKFLNSNVIGYDTGITSPPISATYISDGKLLHAALSHLGYSLHSKAITVGTQTCVFKR